MRAFEGWLLVLFTLWLCSWTYDLQLTYGRSATESNVLIVYGPVSTRYDQTFRFPESRLHPVGEKSKNVRIFAILIVSIWYSEKISHNALIDPRWQFEPQKYLDRFFSPTKNMKDDTENPLNVRIF